MVFVITVPRMTAILLNEFPLTDRPFVPLMTARVVSIAIVVVVVVLCSIGSDDLFWQLMVLPIQERHITEEGAIGSDVSRMDEVSLRS